MHNNKITDVGCKAIAEALKTNRALTLLSLRRPARHTRAGTALPSCHPRAHEARVSSAQFECDRGRGGGGPGARAPRQSRTAAAVEEEEGGQAPPSRASVDDSAAPAGSKGIGILLGWGVEGGGGPAIPPPPPPRLAAAEEEEAGPELA